MIIVSYLTENFIKETLKEDASQLRYFLESLCIVKENIFFVFEPNMSLASIKKQQPKNIKQTNISLWAKYLKDLKRLGRIKDHQFIRDFYKRKNIGEDIHKEQFIKQALKDKVFYLSFKNFYLKKSDFNIESLGEDLEQIKLKIEYLLKDNVKPTKNINNLKDRENLFFDKIAGFCCFYNTLIWIDRYILDNKKFNTKFFLKTPCRLLNGSEIKNLIILTSEPYADNLQSQNPKNQKFIDKEDCINSYINNLEDSMYPNHINIHLFLLMPEELKKIHSRFVSWTSLPEYDQFDFTSLEGLENQIKLSIQPDKGAGYFEDDSKEGFSAQFNYASAADVNGYLSDIINSVPKKDDDSESYKYWKSENYPSNRGWIYYKDIFKKTKVNK